MSVRTQARGDDRASFAHLWTDFTSRPRSGREVKSAVHTFFVASQKKNALPFRFPSRPCRRPAGRPPPDRPAARLNGSVPYATKLKEPEVAEKVEVEEPDFEDEDDGVGLTTAQVQAVMGVLCDETDIAELSVRLGSFELSVRRSLKPGAGGVAAGATAAAAADPAAPAIPTPPAATAFASTASMDGAAASPATATASASLDEDDEESTLLLGAPKVGLLRRGRYVKGKQVGKGSLVAEGDVVKKGQVLGFIEQLGTFVAIEAPQAGEIVEFLADGDPVEYGEPVVSIAPFFGGHIIGDSKHA